MNKRSSTIEPDDNNTEDNRGSSIANRTAAFVIDKIVPRGTLRYLDPRRISENPHQPRTVFDATAMAELTQSIAERGILMPLLGYSDPETPGKVVLIAGHRRLHAAKELGLPRVPILLVDRPVQETSELSIIDAVTENLQRLDLTALEEGEAYRQLVDEYNWSAQKVANKIGKSRAYVAQRVSIVSKLSPRAKERLTAALSGTDAEQNNDHGVTDVTHSDGIHNVSGAGDLGRTVSFDLLRIFNALEPQTQDELAEALFQAATVLGRPLTTTEINTAVKEVKRLGGQRTITVHSSDEQHVFLAAAGHPILSLSRDTGTTEPKRKSTGTTAVMSASARQLALNDLEVARFLLTADQPAESNAGTLHHLIQLYEADLQRLKALSDQAEE